MLREGVGIVLIILEILVAVAIRGRMGKPIRAAAVAHTQECLSVQEVPAS